MVGPVLMLGTGCNSTPPPLKASAWCDNVQGGAPGTGDVLAALGQAHARVRFFGAQANTPMADAALVGALKAAGPIAGESTTEVGPNLKKLLASYAASLPNVCVVTADARALPVASVEMRKSVAIIHPGTGPVTLPAGLKAIAVDLRNLPSTNDLPGAIDAAFRAALRGTISLPTRVVRENDGLPDEAFGAGAPFSNQLTPLVPKDFTGLWGTRVPLAVLTGARITPYAAEWAFNLRYQRKAWLFGENVDAATAESAWSAVGSVGVAFRGSELGKSARWPDYMPTDRPTKELSAALDGLSGLSTPTAVSADIPSARDPLRSQDATTAPFDNTFDVHRARAALLVAQGTAQLFFPLFDVVGNSIDAVMRTGMADLEGSANLTREQVMTALGRMTVALKDAGAYPGDLVTAAAGVLPLSFDLVGPDLVVTRSSLATIKAGDILTAWNGLPMAQVLATELEVTSAATEPYRTLKAMRRLSFLNASVHLAFRSPEGAGYELDVAPQPAASLAGAVFPSRPSGLLTDHPGSEKLYYLNADGSQFSTSNFTATLQAAAGADGVVVDLRGAPALAAEDILPSFVQATFVGPLSLANIWLGPFVVEYGSNQLTVTPLAPNITRPVVLLVSHSSVGEAERIATALVDAARVTLVGRSTAGTVGDISAVRTPGGFYFSFTGWKFLHADHSNFAGLGLTPTAANWVAPAATDYEMGNDPELTRALAVLHGG